jgi:putative MATE family efflux protein
MILAILSSVLFGSIGAYFADDILRMMGASPEVVAEGTAFARIMLGGCVAILLLFLINGIFRGVGDAAMAMKSLWIASGTNIILCPIFIHAFGLKGAALATVVGRSSGVLYQCYHLVRGDGSLSLKARHFNFDFEVIKGVFKVAWPASIQFIIGSGSWIFITRLIAETGGTVASAGSQIAFRNFVFFILPAWGLSNAAATLMGQNLGAKQVERAEKSVWVTAKYSGIFMAFVTLLLIGLADPIIRIFTQDETVHTYGVDGLRIISSGFIFYGISMVLTQALNGAGDTKTPTRINLICFWLFQIPLAYYLANYTDFKVNGALLTVPAAHALMTVIAWAYFKKGKWRDVKV